MDSPLESGTCGLPSIVSSPAPSANAATNAESRLSSSMNHWRNEASCAQLPIQFAQFGGSHLAVDIALHDPFKVAVLKVLLPCH